MIDQNALAKALGVQSTNKPIVGSSPIVSPMAKALGITTTSQKPIYQRYLEEAAQSQIESDKANSFGTIVKETAKGVGKIVPDFFKILKDTYDGFIPKIKDDLNEAGKSYIKGVQSNENPFKTGAKLAWKGGGRVAADTANVIFAPISAAIGAVLNASGGQKLVDKSGEVIADKSGITNVKAFQDFAMSHPNAGEDFTRILTLVTLGNEKGKISPKTIVERTVDDYKSFLKKIPKDEMKAPQRTIKVKSETGEINIPVKTPASKYDAYLRSQGYEPYVSTKNLPVIEMGPKPGSKSKLPIIKFNESGQISLPKDLHLEMIRPELAKLTKQIVTKISEGAKIDNGTQQSILPKPRQTETIVPKIDSKAMSDALKPTSVDIVKPVEISGTGETKVRGLSQGIESSAIEKNLTKSFGDLPEYQTMNIKEQAAKATQLLIDDYAQAKKIALGQEPAPSGLHPEAVMTAVELRALKDGDVALLRDLATKSALTSEATTMGQRIKLLDERNPDSPVSAIRNVAKAREKALETKGKTIEKTRREIVKEIKQEINKVKVKQDWNSFVDSITC